DARQGAREGAHPAVLGVVAHFAPARVIAVLLAAARIAAGRLEVAIAVRADPHLFPGRRNRERLDAREDLLVAHCAAARQAVAEAAVVARAGDARRRVADVA